MTHAWTIGPLLLACLNAGAADFQVGPWRLPDGSTVSGTISTDGSVGMLTAAQLTGWTLAVDTVTSWVYDPTSASRIQASGVSVSADGRRLMVKRSPDGVRDGGLLAFGSFGPGPEYGVQLANFTGSWLDGGGVAFYLAGAAFEWAWLGEPAGGHRLVARAPTGSTRFRLLPIPFAGSTTMSGYIDTDGTTGPLAAANLVDWRIVARNTQSVRWFKDSSGSNSVVLPASTGFSTDGQTLWVDRPSGYLGFGVAPKPPARGAGVVLADFSVAAPAGGRRGYFNAFGSQYQPLHISGAQAAVGTVIP